MDFNELKETTMDPQTRILKRITIDEAEEMARVFNVCMGSNVEQRRKFIEENAQMANLDY